MGRQQNISRRQKQKGIALIAAMIFVMIFMAMAAGVLSLSSSNLQSAVNHHNGNAALNAALSGLEVAKYQVLQAPVIETFSNTVSPDDAEKMWKGTNGQGGLYGRLLAANLGNKTPGKKNENGREEFETGRVKVKENNSNEQNNGQGNAWAWGHVKRNKASFRLRFLRYDAEPFNIYVQSTGDDEENGHITRTIQMRWEITKKADVLQYALAGRGRMWLTGDTTIHGSIYSAWNLSNAQLTQLTVLEDQLRQQIADGTLDSSSFAALVSSLSLTSANRTTILNELDSGTLTPEKAAQRCIGLMSASSLSVSPFNMTADSTVLGSINSCWSKDQVAAKSWQFETLDADGNPIYQTDGDGSILYETDSDGNYLLDDNGDMIKARVINSNDEIQGVCAGINYGQSPDKMAGLSIADYDTSVYRDAISSGTVSAGSSVISNGVLSKTGVATVTEYFPHKPLSEGGYSQPASSSSQKLTRYKYENKTLRNVRVSNNTNAVFKNCTFEEVLYVDCASNTNSNFNNIRFENCTFNGVIVTNTPNALSWQKNALYFTGSATFQNTSSVQEATILAPHFNVDLGNTNPIGGDNNVLTGAIVGGIVDIRGNAEIYGTIIAMADTSAYSSGYVTNIGATLNDGGSETTEAGDVGTIEITPNPDQLLPSGIKSPVVFSPDSQSYAEIQ